jgi:hypothetical protein
MDSGSYLFAPPRPAEPRLPLEITDEKPAVPLIAPKSVMASVPYAFVEVLADLALDTQRVMGGKRPLDESGPETSTPATGGAGPASDLVSQPHVNAVLGGTNNTEKGRRKRCKKQLPSSPYYGSRSRLNHQSEGDPPWLKSDYQTPATA